MRCEELLVWVNELEKLNESNNKLLKITTKLKKKLDFPDLVRIIMDIQTAMNSISDINPIYPLFTGELPGSSEKIGVSAEEIYAKITGDIYDFMSSLSKGCVTIRVPQQYTVEQQIQNIYKKYKSKIAENQIAEKLKMLPPKDDLEWCKLFFESEVRGFQNEKENWDVKTAFEVWINFTAIYQPDTPQEPLTKPIINYSCKGSIEDYSQGKNITVETQNKADELIQYSMILAEKNALYRSKFNIFKQNCVKDVIQTTQKQAAYQALIQIKELIGSTDWKLGKWGSQSKIEINGKSRPVPNHIYEIYEKAKEGMDNPATAATAMEDINRIAHRAITYKATFLACVRQRDEITQKVYEEIVKQSRLPSPGN